MTPTELAQQWQAKLSAARSELSEFEQRMGELALTDDAGALAQRLGELKNAVIVAEAAAETARKNAPDPRIERKRQQLTDAQAGAAQWRATAERWAAIQKELEPRYVEARDRCVGAINTMAIFERSVDAYQAELSNLLRAEEIARKQA